ncbi:peptide-methionine (S)-S-oxide reductase [Tamilnaduibacter salinus]|uniref:Peptide methionine sulfoxide reductase MsrA n=1 Tax=Tamilnaduibacter salinus TaxID=1484056 RepID=A0A2U1CW54_9GAMM|nr:peptide-methionine (S)-S-oxide reductase MsrA [Tamilnaduibacter salinus]PVY75976.1 peptide-methionine (S)-S-oxide reductase [Tamilnaduibacter salinus]
MSQSCDIPGTTVPRDRFPLPDSDLATESGATEERLVLAGGCFWCVEALYQAVEGVKAVTSGYAGGSAETANYKAVCTGNTDHAEAVEVRYDPSVTSFGELLRLFFSVAHDPTQLNRQGHDTGPQYRSAIFYESEAQEVIARAYIHKLDGAGVFRAPIVTSLEPLTGFYPAEDYHQDFAARNPHQPYVMAVAGPKLDKLRDHFGDRMKSDHQGED